MKVTNPAHRARAAALVDKALGYPKEADSRGANCPPAPFGRTERYAEDMPDPDEPAPAEGQPDNRSIVYVVPEEIADRAASDAKLTGQERAEFASIRAAANGGQGGGQGGAGVGRIEKNPRA